jgi:hypothetical protein
MLIGMEKTHQLISLRFPKHPNTFPLCKVGVWGCKRESSKLRKAFPLLGMRNFEVHHNFGVATLVLGSQWKQRFTKVWAKNEALELHFMLLGMWENVRECTSTLPNEFSIWELESEWTFKFSKNDYKGQNSLDWKFLYIIGKLLELKCLKWARMTHLGHTSYGQKKG